MSPTRQTLMGPLCVIHIGVEELELRLRNRRPISCTEIPRLSGMSEEEIAGLAVGVFKAPKDRDFEIENSIFIDTPILFLCPYWKQKCFCRIG